MISYPYSISRRGTLYLDVECYARLADGKVYSSPCVVSVYRDHLPRRIICAECFQEFPHLVLELVYLKEQQPSLHWEVEYTFSAYCHKCRVERQYRNLKGSLSSLGLSDFFHAKFMLSPIETLKNLGFDVDKRTRSRSQSVDAKCSGVCTTSV